MSADYVRAYYKVPAKRGGRVLADGKAGRITGFDGQYLRVRLDGEKHSRRWHAVWHMKYLDAEGKVAFHQPCRPTDGCCKSPAVTT